MRRGAIVVGFTLVAAVVHVLGQSQRPLWLDEACTYWTVQARALDVLLGARSDGTPPLHFLIVAATTHVFGFGEFALRLPSIVAATALVPAIYAVTRRFATVRTALVAAGLAAISPLVHYYSVEARSYALVQLETLAIVYAARRAFVTPDKLRWWVALCLAHALQLWTHNYAVFLLPVVPLVCLAAGDKRRVALSLKATAAVSVAFLLYLPWFLRAQSSAAAGVGDWIALLWAETPPYAALFRSIEVFGFGAAYPWYLQALALAPTLRVLSISLTVGLLALAAVSLVRGRGPSPPAARRAGGQMLFGFLCLPLLGAWAYSLLGQPLYLVGRYDTIVLPVFLVLLAVGIDRTFDTRSWIGWAVVAGVVGLAGVSLSPALAVTLPDTEDVLAARYLITAAAPDDRIVSTGDRRAIVSYYLDRAGHRARLTSFPAEVGGHPGWYSGARLLLDRDRLAKEGQALADELATGVHGQCRWVLTQPPNDVDRYLFRPLVGQLAIDERRSRRDWRVICVTNPESVSRHAP
jgi:4-amino-4-deoxy-L-arabinose transferase-like glycosyltransferase